MSTEIEIKLKLPDDAVIDEVISRIEKNFSVVHIPGFIQKTVQFFEQDFTKQKVFPRLRNEETGEVTLTLKAKIPNGEDGYFVRKEMSTAVSDSEAVKEMFDVLGFTEIISWEKKRINFSGDSEIIFSLDHTPIGNYLEIEGSPLQIEEAISTLCLDGWQRDPRPYLAIYEDVRKIDPLLPKDMLFSENAF